MFEEENQFLFTLNTAMSDSLRKSLHSATDNNTLTIRYIKHWKAIEIEKKQSSSKR